MTAADSPAGADVVDDADATGVRVRVHPALCEGWGNCHRFASAVYPLDAAGYVDLHLLDVPPELAHEARLGADSCPARAITIIERRPPTHG